MGISKILDNKNQSSKKTKVEYITCMKKNVEDCQYMLDDGKCAMEWCVYEELPKSISVNAREPVRTIKCSICDKRKYVSIYSSQSTEYICDECKRRIKELIYNE